MSRIITLIRFKVFIIELNQRVQSAAPRHCEEAAGRRGNPVIQSNNTIHCTGWPRPYRARHDGQDIADIRQLRGIETLVIANKCEAIQFYIIKLYASSTR